MLTAQVLAVEVGGVAVAVPPGTVVEGGAVVLRVVVVPVFGGELHSIVLQQRVAYGGKRHTTTLSCGSAWSIQKVKYKYRFI